MSKTREQEANILKNLAGAWMLMNGQELPGVVIPTVVKALEPYSTESILSAIESVVMAGNGRMTLGAIVERLNAADGRPSPEEAWSTAIQAMDEAATVVWTTETAQAWADVGFGLMEVGDKFNASRGFIAKYQELCEIARKGGFPARWVVSQGHDKDLRHSALETAYRAGRISRETCVQMLPRHNQDAGPIVAAIAGNVAKMIGTDKPLPAVTDTHNASQRLKELIAVVAAKPDAPARKPSADNNVRIVNEAIDCGVLKDRREIDRWMTAAKNRDDVSELQRRMLESRHAH